MEGSKSDAADGLCAMHCASFLALNCSSDLSLLASSSMELHTSGFSSYCLNTSITKLNSLIGTAYFKYLTSCYKRYDEHISKVRAV